MKLLSLRTFLIENGHLMSKNEIKEFFGNKGIDFENEVEGNADGYGYFGNKKIILKVNNEYYGGRYVGYVRKERPVFYLDADLNEYYKCEDCGKFHKKSEVNFISLNYYAETIRYKHIVCNDCFDNYQKDLIYANAREGRSVWFKFKENFSSKAQGFYVVDGIKISQATRESGTLCFTDELEHCAHLLSITPKREVIELCSYYSSLYSRTRVTSQKYIDEHPDEFFVCDDCGTLYWDKNAAFRKKVQENGEFHFICSKCLNNDYVESVDDVYLKKNEAVSVENSNGSISYYPIGDARLESIPKCPSCGKYSFNVKEILGEKYCGTCCSNLGIADYHDICIKREDGRYETISKGSDEGQKFYTPLFLENEKEEEFVRLDDNGEKIFETTKVEFNGNTFEKKIPLKTKTAFGFEIETYQDRNHCVYIHDKYGDIFNCERDSSLDDVYGVEMISRPMSWAYLLSQKDRLADFFQKICDDGAKGHDAGKGYGLHVHVSRTAFVNDKAQHLVSVLINYFFKDVETFARRTAFEADNYCRYQTHDVKTVNEGSYYENTGHGCSVNYGNRKTIEIRVFRSTLNINTLMATIEFVKNVVEVCNLIASKEEYKNSPFASIYHTKNLQFKDLLKGQFIPTYVADRELRGKAFENKTLDLNGYFVASVKGDYSKKLATTYVNGREVTVLKWFLDNRDFFASIGINFTPALARKMFAENGKEFHFFAKPEASLVSQKSIERAMAKIKKMKGIKPVRIQNNFAGYCFGGAC